MTITTKTGDDGKSRFQGKVIDKDSLLLEAVGAIDELQSLVDDIDVQKDLYGIMGQLAYGQINNYELSPKGTSLRALINNLEERTGELEGKLKPIKEFLIFKNEKARKLNFVRTVCRRTERRLVSLNRSQQIDPNILIYINRLSDYLFMLSREAEE